MELALQVHRPSERARRQAEAAGLDLETLRRNEPERYKMLNAEAFVAVHARLLELASNVFFAAFRHYGLFQLPGSGEYTELRSFPALSGAESSKLDDALARLAALEPYRSQHAFYRVVRDRRGVRRQLGFPISPDDWQGGEALVGPFAEQLEAEAWAKARIGADSGLLSDAVPQGGSWFCDLFPAGLE